MGRAGNPRTRQAQAAARASHRIYRGAYRLERCDERVRAHQLATIHAMTAAGELDAALSACAFTNAGSLASVRMPNGALEWMRTIVGDDGEWGIFRMRFANPGDECVREHGLAASPVLVESGEYEVIQREDGDGDQVVRFVVRDAYERRYLQPHSRPYVRATSPWPAQSRGGA